MRLLGTVIILVLGLVSFISCLCAMDGSRAIHGGSQVPAKKRYVTRYAIREAEIQAQRRLNVSLFKAVIDDRLADVKQALEAGAFVNVQDKNGNTPLHDCDSVVVARLLLDNKADPSIANKEGVSMLSATVRGVSMSKIIQSLLFKAAKEGCVAGAQKALEWGACVNEQDKEGNTPLHGCDSIAVVRLLLENRVDPTIENNRDETVLHFAHVGADVIAELIKGLRKTLKKCGMNVGQFINSNVSSKGDARFCTLPLHVHAASGNHQTVALLVLNGADVNRCDRVGFAPLHLAECAGTVEQLITLRADVNQRSKGGQATPMHFAHSSEVVRLLCQHKANVNVMDKSKNTPLHTAGNADVALALLERGAQPNVQNYDGKTPLHMAIDRLDMDVIDVLLQKQWGVNLELFDKSGDTVFLKVCKLKLMNDDGDVSLILANTLLAAGARMPGLAKSMSAAQRERLQWLHERLESLCKASNGTQSS